MSYQFVRYTVTPVPGTKMYCIGLSGIQIHEEFSYKYFKLSEGRGGRSYMDKNVILLSMNDPAFVLNKLQLDAFEECVKIFNDRYDPHQDPIGRLVWYAPKSIGIVTEVQLGVRAYIVNDSVSVGQDVVRFLSDKEISYYLSTER